MKRLSPLLIVAAVFALRALAQVVDITQLNTPTNVYSDGGGVWITGGSVNATVPVPIGVVILDGGNLGTTAYQGTSPWVTSGTSTATIVQPIAVVILDGGNLGVTAYQGTSPWSDNIADVGGSAAVTAKTGVLQVGVIGGDGGYVGVYEAVQPIGVTIVDGGNIFATLVGTSPVSVGATISQPLGVTIVDGGNIFATLSGNNYVQAVIDGGVAVGGWAGAAPISIQGSADGGLPVAITGTITATVGTPQGVTILDGGNLFAAVQGTAGGVPVVIQGAADGGLPVAVQLSSGPGSDGGFGVSGTVTATQGTAAATSAPWPVEITDGTNGVGAVKAASTAAVAADRAQVVAVSPNNTVQVQGGGGGAPLSIQGSADGGLPVAITGTITATVGTPQGVTILDGGNLFVTASSLSTTPFNAQTALVTHTSAADSLLGLYSTVQLEITSVAGTGSPSGCTIQLQSSVDGTNYSSNGTAVPFTFGTPVESGLANMTLGLGAYAEYVFACSTYPTGSATITVKAVYSIPTQMSDRAYGAAGVSNAAGAISVQGITGGLSLPVTATVTGGTVQGTAGGVPISIQGSADGGLPVAITGTITATVATPQGVTILDGGNLFAAVQGTAGGLPISVQGSADGGLPLNVAGAVTVSGTVTATVTGGTVQGTAGGVPISVQGSADGGLALNVDNSSGPLSDGGVACSNAVAANLNADVILASGPGSDGGWAVSNATAANLNATCQGAAGGVPISIQGAADGGFPVYATDLADNKIDAGVGTWAQVTSGLTGTNGTTPTAAPAGVTLPNLVNQDGVQYVHIGPPNAIHYYESTSSEALVIVAPATGTSYYLTDWTLSCGTTAQEVKLLDCDAGTIVTYEDVYCAASGGATHSQISPVRIVAGKSVCCDPVGGTTATCTTDGYVAP